MRDISIKADDVGDTLSATDFNALNTELENAVESADFTLDAQGGPDTNLEMLAKTMMAYAHAGMVYNDSGAADAVTLALGTNLLKLAKYYDNMKVVFQANNTNTGASTLSVSAISTKDLTRPDGVALKAEDIIAGRFHTAIYNLSDDRFELVMQNYPKKQYLGDGTDFDVTGQAGFALVRAVATPYKTSDGAWHLRGNISFTQTSNATCDIALSNVVFKSGADQAVTPYGPADTDTGAYADGNTDDIIITSASAQTIMHVSFDLELNAKPSWAD